MTAPIMEVFMQIPYINTFEEKKFTKAFQLFSKWCVDGREKDRIKFFEYISIPEDVFPWAQWRQMMGLDRINRDRTYIPGYGDLTEGQLAHYLADDY